MTKQQVVKQVLAKLRKNGLLNEAKVKSFLKESKRSLKEGAGQGLKAFEFNSSGTCEFQHGPSGTYSATVNVFVAGNNYTEDEIIEQVEIAIASQEMDDIDDYNFDMSKIVAIKSKQNGDTIMLADGSKISISSLEVLLGDSSEGILIDSISVDSSENEEDEYDDEEF